jgi:DNA-directed RNA polymerase subunit RPC12/RpoP
VEIYGEGSASNKLLIQVKPIKPKYVDKMDRKLKTIPEPKKGTQTVFASKTLPVIKSKKGNTTYLCCNCGAKLGETIIEGKFKNVVLKCPTCNSYNEV